MIYKKLYQLLKRNLNHKSNLNPGIFWKGDRSSRFDLLKEGGLEFTLKFVIDGNGTKEVKPKADGIEDQLEPIEL